MSRSLPSEKNTGTDLLGVLQRLALATAADIAALPDRMADRVHEIRIRMKKIRAILRLAEPSIPRADFLQADRAARDIKEQFGSLRDTDVQRDLLEDLMEGGEAREAAARLGLLQPPHAPDSAGPAAALRQVASLEAILRGIRPGNLTPAVVMGVWVASYRDARHTLNACRRAKAGDSMFHTWRKRVKVMLYQAATLGSPLRGVARKAEKLASVLGTHHDLAILCDRLSAEPELSRAARLALKKKSSCGRRALLLGKKLFADKPSLLRKQFDP